MSVAPANITLEHTHDLHEGESEAPTIEHAPDLHPSTPPDLADVEDHTPLLPPREPMTALPTSTGTEEVTNRAPEMGEQDPPQVAALRGMFPDFDSAVLLSILESVNYDQDRAIDLLLGMSDPSYVSTTEPAPPNQPDLSMDEQLARQLALEDEQQQPRRAVGQSWPRRDQVPYQPRQHQPHPYPQQEQQEQQGYVSGSERGDFQEFQETFNRIAESGKRTFSSIVSKAKAKINEYQQGRPSQSSPPRTSTEPQWGSAPSSQFDRRTAQQTSAQEYYGYDHSEYQDMPRQYAHAPQVQAYDVGAGSYATHVPIIAPTPVVPPPRINPKPVSPSSQSPAPSPRPSGDTPRPPPTMGGSPINAAKLGLLPKRTVNLLNTQPSVTQAPQVPQPQQQSRRPSDDLDYIENPFEEGRD